MQVISGLLILGILQFIIKCNGAFLYDPRNLEKIDKSHIVKDNLHLSSGGKTYNELNPKLEISEVPGITDSATFSLEKLKDTLKAQFKEAESTVYILNDVPQKEYRNTNEKKDKHEKLNQSSDDTNNSGLTQNAYSVSKSYNKKQYRNPRFIPEEIYFSNPHGGRFPRQVGLGFAGPGGMSPPFMSDINAMLPFGVPPAAYIPAPGGGIIPAIPPSTFIPPPPMPFPGAWGPFGFAGHGMGFPPLPYTSSFFGGPLLG